MAGAATLAASVIGNKPLLGQDKLGGQADVFRRESNKRAIQAAKLRCDVAQENFYVAPRNLQHPDNGDERLYPNKIGNYSKGLPHNSDGTVVVSAYDALLEALSTERQNDFNSITLGGDRKLVNPQSGLAFDMEGADSHSFVVPPAPAFNSREIAAEIAENYWMALLRDVSFEQYETNPTAQAAAADLTHFGADLKARKTEES